MKSEKIAVIIPMFNVEKHIEKVIESIPDLVDLIIIVDDHSRDNSVVIVKNIPDKRLIVIEHEVNKGVGGAMISGFKKAMELCASIVIKVDGDGQMPMDYLNDLISPILLGQADFSKGNRFANFEDLTHMPLIRRIGNLGLSFITKAASGYWNVFDPTNGFFAMDGPTLRKLRLDDLHPRYFFESSLLCTLYRVGSVIEDIPMPAKYGEETSSLSEWKTLFEFPPLLFVRLINRIWLRYFVMDFSVASISLIFSFIFLFFGCVWGLNWWYRSIQTGIPATSGTVIIAALPVILGFQLFLQFLTNDVQNIPNKPINKRGKTLI